MTKREVVCAVDVGSTAVKAAVYTSANETLAHTVTYLSLHRTEVVVEIDPEDLWRGVTAAVRSCVSQARRKPTTLVITTQMAGQCFLDQHDRPIGSILMGLDRRHDPHAESIRDSRQVSRLAWWATHRPDELRAARRLGGIKEYLLWRATQEWVIDPSSASVSGYYAFADQTWSPPAFLDHIQMPSVTPSEQVIGTLSADAATEFALAPGTEVICGIGDGPAASLAVGAVGAGRLCLTLGTTSVARLILDANSASAVPAPTPAIFIQHLQDGWYCTGTRAERDIDLTDLVRRWDVDEIRVIGGRSNWSTLERLATTTRRRVCTTGATDGTAGAALVAFHPQSWLQVSAALPVATAVNPTTGATCQS